MAVFTRPTAGVDDASAAHVNQYADALTGVSAETAVPVALTALVDPVNYAFAARNQDAGSKTAVFYYADGSAALSVDSNGVRARPTIGGSLGEVLIAGQVNAVTTPMVTDASITTAKLASDAVETAKIKDAQVTAAKMAANAIATATVQDAAITAAKLAADAGNFGASAAWTPTVTQGVAVTVTVNFATYVLIGKLVVVRAHLGITSSGTAGSAIVIGGWPTAINPRHNATYGAVGQMAWRDDSTGAVAVGIAAHPSSTTLQLWTNTATSPLGSVALAANDSISFTLVYEVA